MLISVLSSCLLPFRRSSSFCALCTLSETHISVRNSHKVLMTGPCRFASTLHTCRILSMWHLSSGVNLWLKIAKLLIRWIHLST
uniref:Putative secreted protein n=1 Tax=Ixodes ricinus TaxID=34613 RepID=A0A6B0U6N5_IXORI